MADSAGGQPSRTATTILAARKHHVFRFRIDGYSNLNTHGARPRFNSVPFRSGGRIWRISYRPMGSSHRPDNTDSVGFYLALDDDVAVDEAVMAQETFSLLDHGGRPVPEYTFIFCFPSRMNNFATSWDMAFGFERFIRREDLERSEHILRDDDSFAVRVQVYVARAAPAVAVPPPDMRRHIGGLLASKEDADVGGETFEAHRLVLGARSPVFMAELLGPMKEGMAAADTTIRVDDMEPRVFGALLSFMYTDTWPTAAEAEEEEDADECVMAQHLLVAADRYGMERLKLMCEDKLREHIDTGSAATILALAEKHCCLGLKEACFEFLGSATALLALVEAEEDFEYLARSCPRAVEELISKVLGRDVMEKVKNRKKKRKGKSSFESSRLQFEK